MENGTIPFRSHTALLLSTALPFLKPSFRHPVELALKFMEFSETLKLYREFHDSEPLFPPPDAQATKNSGLFGLIDAFVLDLEGLLQSLSKVCIGDEKEMVTMFLNLIRAKNFYDTYGDLMKSMMTPEGGGSPFPFPFGEFHAGTAADSTQQPDQMQQSNQNPSTTSMPSQEQPQTPPDQAAASSSQTQMPFPVDLSSMLTNDQKETLDLLKSLFANE